jgi:hypothetical protein
MRITDEELNLLLNGGEHGRQQLADGGGWPGPSADCAATAVCLGEMLSAHACSGVAAKVPGVLRRIRGAGDRDFSLCGSGVSSSDAADRGQRGRAGVGVRQYIAIGADAWSFSGIQQANSRDGDHNRDDHRKDKDDRH